jgi:hypothetical protein
MKHLTEEELIEVYCGEDLGASPQSPQRAQSGEGGAGWRAHLAGCSECSARVAELQRDLAGVKNMAVPERGLEYGEQVWQALRPQLVPYIKKPAGWRAWAQWKAVLLVAGCAAVAAAAFVGGRVWERHAKVTVTATHANPDSKQRVVLVVLTDHLDRTERLLVSLEHADSSDRTGNALLQSEARDLVASNRLYRAAASNAGDPVLAGALNDLQGVLAEVANDPNLTAEDLERLRNEMNTEGILFEIRVLRARGTGETSGPKPAKGATI